MDRVTRTKYLANTYKYFGLHERREDVYDNVDGCRVVKFQSGSFSLSLSVYICICIWRERRESWAERELSELTIESDGANRDALAGPPFNEINHNGAEGTTQSIRYAATSRVATKNTTRIHAPAYRGHVSTGCCSDHWGAIVFTTCIQGGNSDLCFKSFSPFFFFATRFTRFVDFVDSFVEYISKKGKRMLHGIFFYGNNKEISSVFAYYFLEGVWNFLHLTIIPAIEFTVEKFAQVFYSALSGVSLDKVGNKNLIFFCETVW